MGTHIDVNGTVFTDEDIEQWAHEAESEAGYTGKHLGPSLPGRPISVACRHVPSLFVSMLPAERN